MVGAVRFAALNEDGVAVGFHDAFIDKGSEPVFDGQLSGVAAFGWRVFQLNDALREIFLGVPSAISGHEVDVVGIVGARPLRPLPNPRTVAPSGRAETRGQSKMFDIESQDPAVRIVGAFSNRAAGHEESFVNLACAVLHAREEQSCPLFLRGGQERYGLAAVSLNASSDVERRVPESAIHNVDGEQLMDALCE